MNPLTNMKNVLKLSEAELKGRNKTSWHDQYRGSAWLFVGGLPFDLTEGDIICVFSQYGEPVNINLVRDKASGKSKGFCFLCYEDQRSTDLAVDNLNGIKLLGRTLRVDHVDNYKPPKERKEDDDSTRALKRDGLAGVAVRTIEKEKTSTVKVEVKREVSSKKKKPVPKPESESDTDSVSSHKNSKKKRKKEKSSEKHRKKHKMSSSSSSSSESESESSSSSEDEEEPRKRKKKVKTTSDSDSSASEHVTKSHKKRHRHKNHSKEEQIKKGTIKHSKTIEELKREAKLIQEELMRRQKAKDEIENNSAKKSEKHHFDNDEKKRHHSDVSRREDRHGHESRASNDQRYQNHENKWQSHEKHKYSETSRKDKQPPKRRDLSDSSSEEEPSYPEKQERNYQRHSKPVSRRPSRSPERQRFPPNNNERMRNRSRSNERQFHRSRSPEPNSRNRGAFSGRDMRYDRNRDFDRHRFSPRRNRR